MKLDDNFHIDVSDLECTLVERYKSSPTDKNPDGVWADRRYHYATIKQCLKRYLDLCARRVDTVEDILSEINKVENRIDRMFTKLNAKL